MVSKAMFTNIRRTGSVKGRFSFPILRVLPQNHIELLKDRFLNKILLRLR